MKTPNEIIAEYMGGVFEKREIMTIGGKRQGKWTFPCSEFPSGKWCYDDQLQYESRMDWLYPVYIKLRKDLLEIENKADYSTEDTAFTARKALFTREVIESALIAGNISSLRSEIVKGINFINEQKNGKQN